MTIGRREERRVKGLVITVSHRLELGTYFVRDILGELCRKGYITKEERDEYTGEIRIKS